MASERVRVQCRRVAVGNGAALRQALAQSLALFAMLAGGCTLTADEFEPDVARGQVRPEPDTGATCPDGAECCAQVPCGRGEACREGACESVSDGSACTGPDCPPGVQVPLEPRCDAGDPADCGFECARLCEVGESCRADSDCEPDAFCSSQRVCTLATCNDGVQNGAELGMDCGGPCARCPAGTACAQPSDCASSVCTGGRCVEAACGDGVLNGGEVDVDCGGPCTLPCADGRRCGAARDCQSGVCGAQGCPAGVASCCQPPSCSDGVANGDEPAVDCGNVACGLCILGEECAADANCSTGFCAEGRCADPGRCDDGITNGRESAPDCGGGTCPPCADLDACREDSDCNNRNCDERGICISCGDGVVNGSETDVDCGGTDPFCQRCVPGQRCLVGSDCQSGICFSGFC